MIVVVVEVFAVVVVMVVVVVVVQILIIALYDNSCNAHIKFGKFRKLIFEQMRFQSLATGHYARLAEATSGSDGGCSVGKDGQAAETRVLMRGVDSSKDQSYFLATTEVIDSQW